MLIIMLIDILQKGLQGYEEDLKIGDTVHATTLNRNASHDGVIKSPTSL